MKTPSPSGKPKPGLSRAVAFAVAFLLFAAVGAAIRLQDREEPPPSLTYGDIVRPDLQGPLPTSTDIERWESAFTAFDLQWPENDALQTSRPQDLLSFDNEFDGYVAGTADLVGTNLTAVIGFENDTVAWFTCHASGTRSTQTDDFLRTCWDAAAVTDANRGKGAEWIDSVLAAGNADDSDMPVYIERVCPAFLLVTGIDLSPGHINAQLTIAASSNC